MKQSVDVPVDMYESTTELVIIMPLGGVIKESIQINLEGLVLVIRGVRSAPQLKETLLPTQEHCFWGEFSEGIELPDNANFGAIESELTPENVLIIIVPKVVTPEKIMVKIS